MILIRHIFSKIFTKSMLCASVILTMMFAIFSSSGVFAAEPDKTAVKETIPVTTGSVSKNPEIEGKKRALQQEEIARYEQYYLRQRKNRKKFFLFRSDAKEPVDIYLRRKGLKLKLHMNVPFSF